MKCTECNGTGERNGNSEGMDHPVECCFCDGTGVSDKSSQELVSAVKQKKFALENAISIVKFERREYKLTIHCLNLLLTDLENQIEEIRNQE